MSNYILKYGRDERVKYISHLDFMRCFHRAVRRSSLNFVFSQGFNPHPVMTVAQPLPVGVTSESEYMKVGFETELDCDAVVSELNRCMPPGFTVYKAYRLNAKEVDLTKIDRAEYITETECAAAADVEAFMSNAELIVPKKTKSGVKDSDIRPHIFELEDLGFDGSTQKLRMIVSCGSVYNLKPETVIEAIGKYCPGADPGFTAAHKRRMMIGGKDPI